MGNLQLNLLGKLEILLDGAPVTAFESAKSPALLAYLAVTGQAHSRDTLATLLWGDLPEATAKRNLTKALTNLRQLLEPYVLIERHSVAFNHQAPSAVDVTIFQGAIEGSVLLEPDDPGRDLAPLRQAASLYRGDFLEGFYVKNALEFEEWALGQREYLRELMLQGLRRLTEQSARLESDPAVALAYCRRWLGLEPWQEAAHRQMMRLLVQSGLREAALAQYETCRQVLAEELGVEPMAETIALYERIKASGTPPPHNLPPDPNPFVGREVELAQMASLLAQPTCRLLTVVGPGGIGKTRLALEAARRYLQPEAMMKDISFANGVYFVNLAPLDIGADPASLTDQLGEAIAAALNYALHGTTELCNQVCHFLRDKEMLLILDNFEPLAARADILVELLRRASRIKLLVTSRERLNLKEEWMLAVEGLDYPVGERELAAWRHEQSSHIQSFSARLLSYSAPSLFIQRAQQTQPSFNLSEAEVPYLIRICQLVNGMPLGLEIAASWIRLLSCAEIAAQIEQNLDFLETPLRNVLDRHRSLRAVFEQSWQMLSAQEKRIFRSVSVFRGGFRWEAAKKIIGAPLPALAGLVDKSLLRTTATGRYEMHELLRQFATQKLLLDEVNLNQTPDRSADGYLKPAVEPATQVWRWYSAYYLNLVQTLVPRLRGGAPQQAMAEMQLEMDNIRQAWSWASHEADFESIQNSLESLTRFHEIAGLFQEGERLFRQAAEQFQTFLTTTPVSAADQAIQTVLARLVCEQARFLVWQGLAGQAIPLAEKAIRLAQELKDEKLEAIACRQLADAFVAQGSFEAAEQTGERALQLARRWQLNRVRAEVLRDLGVSARKQGNYTQAKALFEEALTCFRALEDRRDEGIVLLCLGSAALGQEDYPEAQSRYEQALQIFREIGDRWSESITLNNLCASAYNLGRYSAAEYYFEQARPIFRELQDYMTEAHLYHNAGNLSRDQGDQLTARDYYDYGLELSRRAGDQYVESFILADFGLFLYYSGSPETAYNYCCQALEMARNIGAQSLQALAWTFSGHALVALGRLPEAEIVYQEALTLRRSLGEQRRAVTPLAGLAQIALVQGHLSQAHRLVVEILDYLGPRSLAGVTEPFQIYLICYRVLKANQDPRTGEALATACRLLQERAAQIEAEGRRRSFLKNITAHRELLKEEKSYA